MYDVFLILCKNDCKGVLHQNVQFFSDLITAVRDLFWYISPHHVKFVSLDSILPTFVKSLIGFDNPERYKNKLRNIRSANIFKLVGIVTKLLEK